MHNEIDPKIEQIETLMSNLSKLSEVQLAMVVGFSQGLTAFKENGNSKSENSYTILTLKEKLFEEFKAYVLGLDGNITEKLNPKTISYWWNGKKIVVVERKKTQLCLEFEFSKDVIPNNDPFLKIKARKLINGEIGSLIVKVSVKSYEDLSKAKEYVDLVFNSLRYKAN